MITHTLDINCVVAARNVEGTPDFTFCTVRCTIEQYNEGVHYEEAAAFARLALFGSPMLVYDRNDGPPWLFRQFNWNHALYVDISED